MIENFSHVDTRKYCRCEIRRAGGAGFAAMHEQMSAGTYNRCSDVNQEFQVCMFVILCDRSDYHKTGSRRSPVSPVSHGPESRRYWPVHAYPSIPGIFNLQLNVAGFGDDCAVYLCTVCTTLRTCTSQSCCRVYSGVGSMKSRILHNSINKLCPNSESFRISSRQFVHLIISFSLGSQTYASHLLTSLGDLFCNNV